MEPFVDVLAVISIAGVAQGVFLGVLFLTTRHKRQPAQHLLAVLILCVSFDIVHHILVHTGYILKAPHFLGFGNASTYLLGPLLYFYTRSFADSSFRLRKIHVLHLIPLLLFHLSRLPDYLASRSEKLEFLHTYYAQVEAGTRTFSLGQHVTDFFVFTVHPLVYLGVALWVLYRIAGQGKQSASDRSKVRWLQGMLISFTILAIHRPLVLLLSYLLPFSLSSRPLAVLVLVFQIYLIAYLALKHPAYTLTRKAQPAKYQRSSVSKSETQKYLDQITSYLETNKAYTDPVLNLQSLSTQVGLRPHLVSQAINEHLGKNVADFINSYRLEEAKRLLLDPGQDPYTIEAIAQAAGFNTRNTFYRVFKKHCDMTPTAFRRLHKNSPITSA